MEVLQGLAPALKFVVDLKDQAAEAAAPKIVNLPLEPHGVYGLWDASAKKLEIRTAATPPRDYRAGSVEAVVKLVDEFVGRGGEELGRVVHEDGELTKITREKIVFVFVQDGLIQVILDEMGDRKERVSLSLTMAPAFKILRDLSRQAVWFKQKEMIDLLRTEIAARYVPENLLSTLRVLKMQTTAKGDSQVKTGRESMGRRVEAQVAGLEGDDLEELENVTVTLPVYLDLLDPAFDYRVVEFRVECSFDVDVVESKFRLKPKAGQIERVLLEADRRVMQDIEADLKDRANVRVFRGTPKN